MNADRNQSPASADAIVVGAGAAGLTAATALVEAGLNIVVLEARDRVGGRAHSLKVDGGTIDLGATWFWANEPRVRALTEQLDLDTFGQHLHGDAIYEGPQVQRLHGNPVDAPASRFAAGAQELLNALARRLPEGALRLNNPVASISVNTNRALVSTPEGEYRTEHLVLAVPPALAAERILFAPDLPPAVRQIAESTTVWMGNVVKAVAVYDRAFWRDRELSGSAISQVGPFREFHDHSGPGGSPAAIFAFAPTAGLPARNEEEIAAALRDQLTRLFGPDAAHPREIHTTDWSTEQYTQPKNTAEADTSSFGHATFDEPVHGRIHWASTETSPAYAGHLEGAILAGLRATQAIRTPAHPTAKPPTG